MVNGRNLFDKPVIIIRSTGGQIKISNIKPKSWNSTDETLSSKMIGDDELIFYIDYSCLIDEPTWNFQEHNYPK